MLGFLPLRVVLVLKSLFEITFLDEVSSTDVTLSFFVSAIIFFTFSCEYPAGFETLR